MKKYVAILVLFSIFGFVFLTHGISAASPSLAKSNVATVEMQNGDKKNVPLRAGLVTEQMTVPEDLYSAIIEPGFPVNTYHSPGMYHAGQAINTLVADINSDWYQEIIVSGLANGPLYSFNHNGVLLSGWPVQASSAGAAYPVYGGGKIIFGIFGDYIKAVDYTGTQIWETENGNFISSPGSIAYSDLHGTYGFYTGEENGRMNGYDVKDGSVLAGWPTNYLWGGQERHTPALYDLDGDGLLENISASGSTSSGVAITAVHQDATVYWNTYIPKGEVDTYPAVGDVDSDGSVEIIVVGSESVSPFRSEVFVLSATGQIERSWLLGSGVPYGTAPALADLNGDRVPEIIVQTDGYVYAMDGYGNELPGWPYSLGSYYWIGNSSPVVGDVDGDYKPEIVFTSYDYYYTGSPSYFYILNHDGTAVPGFPMRIDYIDHGAVPAIADIDRDCHNEVIITGDFWDGYTGYYPTVWAFDLSRMSPSINLGGIKAHGNIEWGQFMSNASHTGVYSPVRTICITSNPADPM